MISTTPVDAAVPVAAPDPVRPSADASVDRWAAWRGALSVWVASRIAVALTAFAGMYLVQGRPDRGAGGFVDSWDRWDVGLFRAVARYGYGTPDSENQAVNFPGLPLLLRAVHAVIPDWTVAGLVISFIAGGLASVALYRLAADESGPTGGTHAVLYLVLFPYAVFLFAGYSEALFLGFAVPAWLAARRDRWGLAALLGAGAAATRITGVAVAVALAVEYLVSRRRAAKAAGAGPLWSASGVKRLVDRRVLWLLAPPLTVLGYVWHLQVKTGQWDAYTVAQERGWNRALASPIEGWRNTWANISLDDRGAHYAWFWAAQLAAVVLGVVLVIALARSRRWGEMTFVGVNLVTMTATSFYASGARAALVWFPLYLLLARLSARRPWVHGAVVWTCAPLMICFVLVFTNAMWVD